MVINYNHSNKMSPNHVYVLGVQCATGGVTGTVSAQL